MRTSPCSGAVRAGRLAKMREFADAAEALADDPGQRNSHVTLCVQAGIAASDVVCCTRLGEHHQGENHQEAVALLTRADPEAAKSLRTLLTLKTRAAYTSTPMSQDDARRARRALESLVEAVQRLGSASS